MLGDELRTGVLKMSVKVCVSKLTRVIGDDQSWIINPFLWIEGKTDVRRNKKWSQSERVLQQGFLKG